MTEQKPEGRLVEIHVIDRDKIVKQDLRSDAMGVALNLLNGMMQVQSGWRMKKEGEPPDPTREEMISTALRDAERFIAWSQQYAQPEPTP